MIHPNKGVLLIAEPFMKDPNFMRSVVFLCDHTENGSFGFVLNKQYDKTLEEILPDTEGVSLPVYFGGPVEVDSLHFLHNQPDLVQGGTEVAPGVFWGGDFDLVIQQLKSGALNHNNVRFFAGYSGWGEGQLDRELKENSWITLKAEKKLVFLRNPNDIWRQSLITLGGDYEKLIHYPIDPQLN